MFSIKQELKKLRDKYGFCDCNSLMEKRIKKDLYYYCYLCHCDKMNPDIVVTINDKKYIKPQILDQFVSCANELYDKYHVT
jgi:hypothetical protein